MAQLANTRETAVGTLSRAYCDGFNQYVVQGKEPDLEHAYELGRACLAAGLGVLDMVALQYLAMRECWAQMPSRTLAEEHWTRAAAFCTESLSPYEMTHRSYRQGVDALRRVNEALESEIHRFAHTIHDEAGQLLVGARLAIADLSHDLGADSRGRLQKVSTILGQAEEQLRRLSHELRPTILDDLGLVPALRFLADGISRRSGFAIHIKSSLPARCPPRVEIALYRIAQEALNNVTKHARAREVQIELVPVADGIECQIQDDGVGFDPHARELLPGGGIGLLGVRERLAALGGTLAIDSSPGRGTCLLLKIPTKEVRWESD